MTDDSPKQQNAAASGGISVLPQTTFPVKVKIGGVSYTFTARMPTAKELKRLPARFNSATRRDTLKEKGINRESFIADVALMVDVSYTIAKAQRPDVTMDDVMRENAALRSAVQSLVTTEEEVFSDDADPISFDDWCVQTFTAWSIPNTLFSAENLLALVDAWPGLASDMVHAYTTQAQDVRLGNSKR